MKRIPEVLQFTVIIKRGRPPPGEFQALQKIDFLRRDIPAQGGISQKLFHSGLNGIIRELPFSKLESPDASRCEAAIKPDLERKRPQVDIPELDHWVQKRGATLQRNAKHVCVQKLKDRNTHLFIAPLTEFSHRTEPHFVAQLVPSDSLRDIEKLLRNQAFEVAEGLLPENVRDFSSPARVALAKNYFPGIFKKWLQWSRRSLPQLFLALESSQSPQFPCGKTKEFTDPFVEIRPARIRRRFFAAQEE